MLSPNWTEINRARVEAGLPPVTPSTTVAELEAEGADLWVRLCNALRKPAPPEAPQPTAEADPRFATVEDLLALEVRLTDLLLTLHGVGPEASTSRSFQTAHPMEAKTEAHPAGYALGSSPSLDTQACIEIRGSGNPNEVDREQLEPLFRQARHDLGCPDYSAEPHQGSLAKERRGSYLEAPSSSSQGSPGRPAIPLHSYVSSPSSLGCVDSDAFGEGDTLPQPAPKEASADV